MSRFSGRAAITGYTRGIGAATAHRLAAEGASLVLVARGESDVDLPATRRSCGDIADASTAAAAVDAALDRFGRLDVLVNNAGIDFTSDLLDAGEADVRAVFDTNFFGALFMLQAAARAMRGGAIVNVTSRLASIGVETMSIYGASKGALEPHPWRGDRPRRGGSGERGRARPDRDAAFDEWVSAQPDPESFREKVAATILRAASGRPRTSPPRSSSSPRTRRAHNRGVARRRRGLHGGMSAERQVAAAGRASARPL